MAQTTGKRIQWIDALRAFAIVAVVVNHVWREYGFLPETELLAGSAVAFFMVSGALIFPIRPSVRAFYKRRFLSYVPQWVVWSAVYMALGYVIGGTDTQLLQRNITWLLFRPAWDAGWFLYALTGLYLFAPVISPWLTTASNRQIGFFLAVWAVSGLTPVASEHVLIHLPTTIFAPFYTYMGYMVLGYWLAVRRPFAGRGHRSGRLCFVAVLAGIVVFAALKMWPVALRWGYERRIVDDLSINEMALWALWFMLFMRIRRLPRLLGGICRLLSTHSLGLYLWHILWLWYVFKPLDWGIAATSCATFAASLLSAVVSSKISKTINNVLSK